MTLALGRGLALLECLCGQPEGMALSDLADELVLERLALREQRGDGGLGGRDVALRAAAA